MKTFWVLNLILLGINYVESKNCINFVKDCGAKPNTNRDNTDALINCQRHLNSKTGGCINIPSGFYRLANVPLNVSNVIVYVEPAVTFAPYEKGLNSNNVPPIFSIGLTKAFAYNVSMIGDASNPFTIDLNNNTIASPAKLVGIKLKGINGFMLANINIKINGNLTGAGERSGISFTHNNVNNSNGKLIRYHPMNGKVINITASDYIYGYGLSQMQSGENIYLENLDGTGGITLRLETGSGNQDGYVNNITAYNVIGRNCHAAFMSAPHSQKNGYFEVHNVTAYSCLMGYSYGGGYTESPGHFKNGSIVDGLIAYYGTTAQINKTPTGQPVMGPACTPCGTGSGKPLNYIVKVSGIQSINFPPPSNRDICVDWNHHSYTCYWNKSSFYNYK